LWKAITTVYELEQHELVLLEQAARVSDRIAALDRIVDAEGVVEPGTGRAHPCLIEARQQRLTLSRIVTSLRLPDQLDQRPQQHRGGVRGFYRPRVVNDGS
jgi:hypothetical protein